MKTLLTLAFTLLSIVATAQARIGFTEAEIRADQTNWTWETDYSDGKKFIRTETANMYIIHSFGDDNLSRFTIVQPKESVKVQGYVQILNDQYVIVSSTKWLMYLENTILECNLKVSDKGAIYFLWTLHND